MLITGASGNVGTALRRRLVGEDVEVVAIARRPPQGAEAAGADWHAVDLGEPDAGERLAPLLAGVDVVVHCAWRIQPSRSRADRASMRAVNVDGTAALVAAAGAAGVGHVVVLSSVGVYAAGPVDGGGGKVAVDESWPATGLASSPYSRQKVAVEAHLDAVDAAGGGPGLTRVRPGLVLQGEAGAEIARYFLGPLVPTSLLGLLRRSGLPVFPLPAQAQLPVVHADDLADALWRAARERVVGGLNVVAADPIEPDDLARALGARRSVPVALGVFRALAWVTWRLGVQPSDPGWVDLAAFTPLLRTERVRSLGWAPRVGAVAALEELVGAVGEGRGGGTPVLRGRSVAGGRMER